jgi:two-component system, NarL family, sensor histidine kinase DevS
VRLAAGDSLNPARRERLEGWAGVVSLAFRAERLRIMRRQVLVAEERSRIAMELHDGAVQRLFGVGMALQGAAMMAGDGDRRVAAALSSAVDEVDAAISEIRAYVHDLRPAGLAAETVRRLVADNVSMLAAAGVRAELRVDDAALQALQCDVGGEFVQLLSEVCGNVARHSRARHVEIRIERRRSMAVLTVTDDGIGFDPTSHTTGHGLRNLRERAARMDGELQITTARGKGTKVRLAVPT